MRKPADRRPKRRESEWGLDEIMKCCEKIPGYLRSYRLAPELLIVPLDEAIKQAWTALTKNHPIQAAIALARVKKINRYAELCDKRPRNTGVDRTAVENDAPGALAEIRREIKMWTTWLPEDQTSIPPRMLRQTGSETLEYLRPEEDSNGPKTEEIKRLAIQMIKLRFPGRVTFAVLGVKSQRARGRPASKRVLTVKALELLLAHPGLYWSQLAIRLREFQPSDPKTSSGGSIRKMVGNLIHVLLKHNVELPPPWNKIDLISFRENYFPRFPSMEKTSCHFS